MKMIASAVMAMIVTATLATGAPHYVTSTPDGFLNVRAGPSTSFEVITQIYPKDQVDTLEQQGHWYRVRLPKGGTGWVAGRYLRLLTSWSGDIRIVQPTDDGFLNLREGPGTSYAILSRIYPGQQVNVAKREGNWLRVEVLNGGLGWVHRAFVK